MWVHYLFWLYLYFQYWLIFYLKMLQKDKELIKILILLILDLVLLHYLDVLQEKIGIW